VQPKVPVGRARGADDLTKALSRSGTRMRWQNPGMKCSYIREAPRDG